jgi:hypothetical protein
MSSRRVFLLTGVAAGVSGCNGLSRWPGRKVGPGPLIDAHCHTFNIKDLSAARFLSWVVAKHYPEQPAPRWPEYAKAVPIAPEDPDWLDKLMQAVLDLVGADRASTAADELARLSGAKALVATDRNTPEQTRAMAASGLQALLSDNRKGLAEAPGESRLRVMVLEAAGEPVERARGSLTEAQSAAIVRRALSPQTTKAVKLSGLDIYLPGLIDFVAELKRDRAQLVDDLTMLHRRARQEPLLLVPAMVDFGRWLRDDPGPGSTFVDQAKVWHAIANRHVGPAVHGYVAFCPLRQVLYERRRFGPGKIETACDAEPLKVVEAALSTQGFLGVKVYPPMGFRAADNASRKLGDHPMPLKVLADVFGRAPSDAEMDARIAELGRDLDRALGKLYDLCARHGAPIMAHGGNSIDAACNMGELADPNYWRPVFERPNAPPVLLAHFGGFNYRTADPNVPDKEKSARFGGCRPSPGPANFEQTWEAWLARYVTDNPGKPVFADVSMFTEALSNGRAKEALAQFKALDERYPRMKDHLVFGTDWVMLAQARNAGVYSSRVRDFIASAFGDGHVDKIMRTNFLRYAGLTPNGKVFERLAASYGGDPRLGARLTLAATA